MSNELNEGNGQLNDDVPEIHSYEGYHSTDEMHSANETTSFSEIGDVFMKPKPTVTLTTSRGMNEALKYSTQVATVIKAVAAITVAAVIIGVPLFEAGAGVEFEYFDLKPHDTYIDYYVEVADYNEDMDLSLTIHNFFISETVPFEGNYVSGTMKGLQPNMQYKATVTNGGVTVAEKSFWTLAEPEPEPTPAAALSIKGVHLEGTERNKLFIDMDYNDPTGVYSVKTMNVYVNDVLSGTDCTVNDVGTKPYVVMDGDKEIGSKNDNVRLELSYDKRSDETGEYVPQGVMVVDGLHVPYVQPIFIAAGDFERGMAEKVTFGYSLDDPDGNWSDFTVSATYYTKDDRDTNIDIAVGESHFDNGFCAFAIPSTVPGCNAAITVSMSCTETMADGTTRDVVLFSDGVVPTVFVSVTPGTYSSSMDIGIEDFIGIAADTECTIQLDYVKVEGGVEITSETEHYGYTMDSTPGNPPTLIQLTFTNPNTTATMKIIDSNGQTASSYSDGHAYLTIQTSSKMIFYHAFLEGVYIMQG